MEILAAGRHRPGPRPARRRQKPSSKAEDAEDCATTARGSTAGEPAEGLPKGYRLIDRGTQTQHDKADALIAVACRLWERTGMSHVGGSTSLASMAGGAGSREQR